MIKTVKENARRNLQVQFGCGLTAPVNWLNFDASPTLRLQRLPIFGIATRRLLKPQFPRNVRFGNVVKGLPLNQESCVAIYCSHVLEHLALSDFRRALRNTFTYLRPDGWFRLVVPDLRYLAQQYLSSGSAAAALEFMRETHLGFDVRPNLLRAWLGNSAHLWMWDFAALELELRSAGFREIRRALFHDSSYSAFSDVEELGRWENCLGVECRR